MKVEFFCSQFCEQVSCWLSASQRFRGSTCDRSFLLFLKQFSCFQHVCFLQKELSPRCSRDSVSSRQPSVILKLKRNYCAELALALQWPCFSPCFHLKVSANKKIHVDFELGGKSQLSRYFKDKVTKDFKINAL